MSNFQKYGAVLIILILLACLFYTGKSKLMADPGKNGVVKGAAKNTTETASAKVPEIAPDEAMKLICGDLASETAENEAYRTSRKIYAHALDLLYMRRFDEARDLFESLGDYKDSREKAKFCVSYPENEPEAEKQIVCKNNLYSDFEHGKVYKLGDLGTEKYTGLVYVPDEVNPETVFIQYYSGGAGAGDDYLWRPGIKIYFETYSPNAIILFTNEPGTGHMHWRNEVQYDLLRQVAKECGTILHDLSAVGSSNGSYTAMMLAADFYLNYGIRVKNVCTLDTGEYWQAEYLELSEKEASAIAEAGTVFYLFEEYSFYFDLGNVPLRRILDAGIETYAVICHHGNHSVISQNAYSLGIFSFSADPEHTVLPTWHYWFLRIDSNTTADDLKACEWTEKPENETRMEY